MIIWKFGYSPDIDSQADSESKYPIAVESNGNVEPGELRVKIYDSWTTRITCLIEGAHRSGETTSTATFNCPDDLRDHYNLCGFEIRRKNNDPASDFICIYNSEDNEDKDCRYTPDINILKQRAFYAGSKNNDVRILRAIPVKINLAPSVINKECPEIKETMKASKGEDAVIVLCFEPKVE